MFVRARRAPLSRIIVANRGLARSLLSTSLSTARLLTTPIVDARLSRRLGGCHRQQATAFAPGTSRAAAAAAVAAGTMRDPIALFALQGVVILL